jgi:diguanylate cyclase (GGDEF)-like protein/PAS domain S-box-containing protein
MKKKNNDAYKEILDNLYDGVYFVDRERRITYWNKGAERITGFNAARMMGHFCHDNLLNHVTENGIQLCFDGCPLHATMADGRPRQAEIYLHHSDGQRIPVQVRTTPIRDENGEITGAVETFSDNSNLMSIRHQVRRLEDTVLLDHLTGIGNRRFMERRLQIALLEFQQQNTPFGVLFMDIDRFKWVNDTYSHETGDKVLTMVANTIRHNLRSEDAVARWGGEEFVVLVAGLDNIGLGVMAEKLRTLVEHSSLRLKDKNMGVTISIGITLVRTDDTLNSIIDRADQNMYKSKRAGHNCVTGDE